MKHDRSQYAPSHRISFSGTPINRLPIMAKQVLDLYELFNLVVARGGLVEVINKKQWQEIIKGLGLPSSITSAAFTLRTQYTKYLYPWEMATRNLSTQHDLQNAIDGNKREGRRIESYNMPPSSCSNGMSPLQMPPFPAMSPLSLSPNKGHNSPPDQKENFNALEMTRLALWKLYNQGQPGMPPLMPSLPNISMDMLANQEKAMNLAAQDERKRREQEVRVAREEEQKQREEQRQREQEARERLNGQRNEQDRQLKERLEELNRGGAGGSPPPAKRQCTSPSASQPMTTNLSMQSREEEDGRTSMLISMEINGIQYKGVLYAKPS